MCTYSQLKKIQKFFVQPPPQGVNGAPYVPKFYASSGKYISTCIEVGTMKLATQVDYVCNVSQRHFRVINVFFRIIFLFLIFYLNIFFNLFFI